MKFDIENTKIPIEKNGKIIECDILFSFVSDERKKAFFGYTDHSIKEGREMMYISSIDLENPKDNMELVKDPEELKLVHQFLMDLDKKVNS